jgi:hypothetical protein
MRVYKLIRILLTSPSKMRIRNSACMGELKQKPFFSALKLCLICQSLSIPVVLPSGSQEWFLENILVQVQITLERQQSVINYIQTTKHIELNN